MKPEASHIRSGASGKAARLLRRVAWLTFVSVILTVQACSRRTLGVLLDLPPGGEGAAEEVEGAGGSGATGSMPTAGVVLGQGGVIPV